MACKGRGQQVKHGGSRTGARRGEGKGGAREEKRKEGSKEEGNSKGEENLLRVQTQACTIQPFLRMGRTHTAEGIWEPQRQQWVAQRMTMLM